MFSERFVGRVVAHDSIVGSVKIIFYADYKRALMEMPPGSVVTVVVEHKAEEANND